jgi:Transcriptional regulator, AbiEi antitoxin
MEGKGATDRKIAALAGAQHGVASRAQLTNLGLTRNEIDNRTASGRLHVVHRGVYAVGHRVMTREGRWMAATLATGGVLSHFTAAAAWGFARSATIHVTVPGDPGRRRRPGVHIHRSRTLTPADTTVHHGIPITEPHRTLADLAQTLNGRPLEHAVNLAERLVDFERLRQAGPPSLQAVLKSYTTPQTRSHSRRRSSSSATTTASRGRTRTRSSKASCATSPGRSSASSSRSTATGSTARPPCSAPTASVTPS